MAVFLVAEMPPGGLKEWWMKSQIFILDPCWLCDTCLAADVRGQRRKPLSRFYPPNEIPFDHRACDQCGAVENCQFYPETICPGAEQALRTAVKP